MKKTFFSLSIVIASAFYVLFGSQNSLPVTPSPSASIPVVADNNPQNSTTAGKTPAPKPAPTPAPSPVPTPTPTPAPKPAGLYADGSYTGTAADAYYGNVQVKAIISGGKIIDVQFLQFPNTHNTSVYINSQAMPYLKQEAIAAQSANVNVVSGATDTSMAFQQSLAAALTQAKV